MSTTHRRSPSGVAAFSGNCGGSPPPPTTTTTPLKRHHHRRHQQRNNPDSSSTRIPSYQQRQPQIERQQLNPKGRTDLSATNQQQQGDDDSNRESNDDKDISRSIKNLEWNPINRAKKSETFNDGEEFYETAQDLATLERTRSVQFISPLLEYGYRPAVEEFEQKQQQQQGTSDDPKPLLLYLPGFDGTFLSPFLQFPELHTLFDVRCMTVGMDDRSTLDELCQYVIQFLADECTAKETDDESTKVSSTISSNITSSTLNPKATEEGSPTSSFPLPWTLPLQIPTPFLTNSRNDTIQRKTPSTATKRSQTKDPPNRSVYLAGESFGGILSLLVSLKLLEQQKQETLEINNQKDDRNSSSPANDVGRVNLQGLTLINAATCYDRSRLASEGPQVASLSRWLYPVGLIKLLPMFLDEYSFAQLLLTLQAKALPSVIDNPCREAYMGRVAFSLPFVLPFMTQPTFLWRLTEWLANGCARLTAPISSSSSSSPPILTQLNDLRILIVAGEKDATLPSIAEAERLASLWPQNSVVHVVEGAGHASTCGSRVDLAALFRSRFKELQPKAATPQKNQLNTSNNNPFFGLFTPKSDKSSKSSLPLPAPQEEKGMAEAPIIPVSNRTKMKVDAANGTGAYFGMTPRYDNANIGLSPLRYWNKEYYRKYRQRPRQR